MPPVAPAMLCKWHDKDATTTTAIAYTYSDSCLVQRVVIARTVNLYHKVAKEPCTFYPSCVSTYMHASSAGKTEHKLQVEDMPMHKQQASVLPLPMRQ